MASEAMTEERLAEIRRGMDSDIRDVKPWPNAVRELVAEVDRLRLALAASESRAAGLLDQNEAIAGNVAELQGRLAELTRAADTAEKWRKGAGTLVSQLAHCEELRDNAEARIAELLRFVELVARMGAFGGMNAHVLSEARRILAGRPVEVSPGAVEAAEELMGEGAPICGWWDAPPIDDLRGTSTEVCTTGKPATFRNCGLVGVPVCEEHRCRCRRHEAQRWLDMHGTQFGVGAVVESPRGVGHARVRIVDQSSRATLTPGSGLVIGEDIVTGEPIDVLPTAHRVVPPERRASLAEAAERHALERLAISERKRKAQRRELHALNLAQRELRLAAREWAALADGGPYDVKRWRDEHFAKMLALREQDRCRRELATVTAERDALAALSEHIDERVADRLREVTAERDALKLTTEQQAAVAAEYSEARRDLWRQAEEARAERDALIGLAAAWHHDPNEMDDAYDALPEALRRRVEG